MSHYVMNYHDCWADLRKAVKAARADYLRKMERLERYADSEQGREDIKAAKSDYQAALEAARAIARPKFAHIIEGMRGKLLSQGMVPPTAEQLATLQMLELRDTIEAPEIEAAAKAMGNNDAALRTLRDVLARKGRTLPTNVNTFEAQTRDAVDELEKAANALLAWDGRTREQIGRDAMDARNSYRWGKGATMTGHELDALGVADMEAASFFRDTCKNIVGDEVSSAAIDAID